MILVNCQAIQRDGLVSYFALHNKAYSKPFARVFKITQD